MKLFMLIMLILCLQFTSLAQHKLHECLGSKTFAREVINYPNTTIYACKHEFTVEMAIPFHVHLNNRVIQSEKIFGTYVARFYLQQAQAIQIVVGQFKIGEVTIPSDVLSLRIVKTSIAKIVAIPKDKKYLVISANIPSPVFFCKNDKLARLYLLASCECQTVALTPYFCGTLFVCAKNEVIQIKSPIIGISPEQSKQILKITVHKKDINNIKVATYPKTKYHASTIPLHKDTFTLEMPIDGSIFYIVRFSQKRLCLIQYPVLIRYTKELMQKINQNCGHVIACYAKKELAEGVKEIAMKKPPAIKQKPSPISAHDLWLASSLISQIIPYSKKEKIKKIVQQLTIQPPSQKPTPPAEKPSTHITADFHMLKTSLETCVGENKTTPIRYKIFAKGFKKEDKTYVDISYSSKEQFLPVATDVDIFEGDIYVQIGNKKNYVVKQNGFIVLKGTKPFDGQTTISLNVSCPYKSFSVSKTIKGKVRECLHLVYPEYLPKDSDGNYLYIMSACAKTCQVHTAGTQAVQKFIFGIAYTQGTIKIKFEGGISFSHSIITPSNGQPILAVYFKPYYLGYYHTKAIFKLYDKQGKFHMQHVVKITGVGLHHEKKDSKLWAPPSGMPRISGVCYVSDPKFKVSGSAQVVKDKDGIPIGHAILLVSGMYLILKNDAKGKTRVRINNTLYDIRNASKISVTNAENPVAPSANGLLIRTDVASKLYVYDNQTNTLYNLYLVGKDTSGSTYYLLPPTAENLSKWSYLIQVHRNGGIKGNQIICPEIIADVPPTVPANSVVCFKFIIHAVKDTLVQITVWGNVQKIVDVQATNAHTTLKNNRVSAQLWEDLTEIRVYVKSGEQTGPVYYKAGLFKIGKGENLPPEEIQRIGKLIGLP